MRQNKSATTPKVSDPRRIMKTRTHFSIAFPNVTSLARFLTFCSFSLTTAPFPDMFFPFTPPFANPASISTLESPGCEITLVRDFISANCRTASSCVLRRRAFWSSVSGGRVEEEDEYGGGRLGGCEEGGAKVDPTSARLEHHMSSWRARAGSGRSQSMCL